MLASLAPALPIGVRRRVCACCRRKNRRQRRSSRRYRRLPLVAAPPVPPFCRRYRSCRYRSRLPPLVPPGALPVSLVAVERRCPGLPPSAEPTLSRETGCCRAGSCHRRAPRRCRRMPFRRYRYRRRRSRSAPAAPPVPPAACAAGTCSAAPPSTSTAAVRGRAAAGRRQSGPCHRLPPVPPDVADRSGCRQPTMAASRCPRAATVAGVGRAGLAGLRADGVAATVAARRSLALPLSVDCRIRSYHRCRRSLPLDDRRSVARRAAAQCRLHVARSGRSCRYRRCCRPSRSRTSFRPVLTVPLSLSPLLTSPPVAVPGRARSRRRSRPRHPCCPASLPMRADVVARGARTGTAGRGRLATGLLAGTRVVCWRSTSCRSWRPTYRRRHRLHRWQCRRWTTHRR